MSMISSSSAPFLECPICQQSLLLTQQVSSSPQEPSDNHARDTELITDSLQGDTRSSTRWSPMCTPCGHMFHKVCITEWFRIRRNYDGGSAIRCSCPSCRKLIAYHKLIRVYLPTIPTDNHEMPFTSTPVPRCPRSSSTGRVSVSEAVRRYNNQHLLMDDASNGGYEGGAIIPTSQQQNTSRIYNDFFGICGRINTAPQPPHPGRSTTRSPHHLRSRRGGHGLAHFRSAGDYWSNDLPAGVENVAGIDLNCENEDCVALKNVYEVLTMEFRSLQRKLEQEVDIGRMKSILVAGLQQDVEHLKKMKSRNLPMNRARVIGILIISFICFWISACAILVFF